MHKLITVVNKSHIGSILYIHTNPKKPLVEGNSMEPIKLQRPQQTSPGLVSTQEVGGGGVAV